MDVGAGPSHRTARPPRRRRPPATASLLGRRNRSPSAASPGDPSGATPASLSESRRGHWSGPHEAFDRSARVFVRSSEDPVGSRGQPPQCEWKQQMAVAPGVGVVLCVAPALLCGGRGGVGRQQEAVGVVPVPVPVPELGPATCRWLSGLWGCGMEWRASTGPIRCPPRWQSGMGGRILNQPEIATNRKEKSYKKEKKMWQATFRGDC